MKKEIQNHWSTWIFIITLGIILIMVYKALDSIGYLFYGIKRLFSILSPFFAGLLLAYLLYSPERRIENSLKKNRSRLIRKNSRKIGIFITYIITLIIVLVLIKFIIPVLFQSINELIGNLQGYYTNIISSYNKLPDDSLFKTDRVYDALKEIQNFDIKQYLSIEKITGYIKGAVGAARGIFDIFVAIVVSIYILSERNQILSFIKRFSKAIFKKETYEYLEKYFYKSNAIFFRFISSQLIDAIIVGVIAAIAMNIMKVKYASLLGFIIGLFNMIPYFGAIIAVLFAGLITLITGGFSKAIIMLIVIIILQQIDANIINPKIVGDSLKISPLIVILAVTVGGAYFGIIGMFLAVPISAVLKLLVNDYIDNKTNV